MRRLLAVGTVGALLAVPTVMSASASGESAAPRTQSVPSSPTTRIAGLQHWCATNGVTCTEPLGNWDEIAGYAAAIKSGAQMLPYIGHDEPALLFYSHKPGSGNDVTYQVKLPTDPPTKPRQDGSGGTYDFQRSITYWFGMLLCDDEGTPNPDGKALTGHPTRPCRPDSDSNIYASTNRKSSHYFGFGPGQAFMEMQFYPPSWVNWPAGTGCDAHKWCAALNIDTFSENLNTGQFNNTACLNTAGPEPVNFAFLTKNGKATAPGNALHPEHFVPNLRRTFLMGQGDRIRLHMSDSAGGFRVTVDDVTSHTSGSMTASAANGFGSVVFDPHARSCSVRLHDFHPMYSTSTEQTRNFSAAHTYNVSASDEIGHFEYCARVKNDALGTCAKPLGDDTNDGDNAGPDPQGDDVFCLPASASTLIRIGGCLNTDGDFDGVSYKFTWPGSISNPTADALLNGTPIRFTSPTTKGAAYQRMRFESDISRNESDDTAFRVGQFCQRHILNPADPNPGAGCVNPPPNSDFYPIYTTINVEGRCWWQQGGPYIPGTTNTFGGNAHHEYGSLQAISYPANPTGTITKRYNDFSRTLGNVPCKS